MTGQNPDGERLHETQPASGSHPLPAVQHLTDAQFSQFVLGEDLSPAGMAHVSHCDTCREELGRFGASMQEFSRATLAWSEARPARPMPAPADARTGSHSGAQSGGWMTSRTLRWALPGALAAGLAFAAGYTSNLHWGTSGAHGERAGVTSGAILSPGDSEAQIAEDNQLMLAVSKAIAPRVSPVQEYGLDGAAALEVPRKPRPSPLRGADAR